MFFVLFGGVFFVFRAFFFVVLLELFFVLSQAKPGISALTWSPTYINETKTPVEDPREFSTPHKCPWSRDQKPRPGCALFLVNPQRTSLSLLGLSSKSRQPGAVVRKHEHDSTRAPYDGTQHTTHITTIDTRTTTQLPTHQTTQRDPPTYDTANSGVLCALPRPRRAAVSCARAALCSWLVVARTGSFTAEATSSCSRRYCCAVDVGTAPNDEEAASAPGLGSAGDGASDAGAMALPPPSPPPPRTHVAS